MPVEKNNIKSADILKNNKQRVADKVITGLLIVALGAAIIGGLKSNPNTDVNTMTPEEAERIILLGAVPPAF